MKGCEKVANSRNVLQQITTVSVPKKELLEYVVYSKEFNKKDLRVFLMLLTELNGYSPSYRKQKKIDEAFEDDKDPLNFRKIDSEQIADELELSEKDVRKSIKKLLREGVIEKGDSRNAINGYRFKF